MPKLLDPGRQITDGTTALPVASGKAYFSEPGTTTEKTVYSDDAMSVAISQPITLNSEGRFPAPPYGSGEFRLQVYDSTDTGTRDGVLIFDEDNIRGATDFSDITLTAPLKADDSTSVAAPVYTFDGDTNTGIAHPAADVIAGVTGGSERWRTNPAGNTGFGKTNPVSRIDVDGQTRTDSFVALEKARIGESSIAPEMWSVVKTDFTVTTGAVDIATITVNQANMGLEILAIFNDIAVANGSIVQRLQVAANGSSATLSAASISQQDLVRSASGSLTNYFTWTVGVSGSVMTLSAQGTVASGVGTMALFIHGVRIASVAAA